MPNDPEPMISSPSASEFEDAEDLEHPRDESSSQQNRLGSGRKFTDTQRIYILMALSEARGRLYIPAKATRITEKIYTEACNILDNNWADKTGLEGRHPNRKSVRTLWKRFVSTGTLARKGGGRKKSNIDAELIEILKKEEQSEEPFSLRKIASMMPEDRRVSAVTIARRLADLKKPQRNAGGAQREQTPVKNVPQKKQPAKTKKVQNSKQRQPKPPLQQCQPGEEQQSRLNQQPEQISVSVDQEQAQFQELRPQKQEFNSDSEQQATHQNNEHNQYQTHQIQHPQLQNLQYRNPPPQLQLQLPVGQNQLRSTNTHNVDNRHNNEFTIQLSFVPDDKLTVVDGK